MSHDHQDRVAERPGHMCAAYGCPMIGTSSASTQGTSEWWCFAHFGKDVGAYQRITVELNALAWLSDAVRDVRIIRAGTPESKAAMALLKHNFELNGRKDLLVRDDENRGQWLLRLETELGRMISDAVRPAPRQKPIVQAEDTGSFSRVGFDMPEPA